MNATRKTEGLDLPTLFALFPGVADVPAYEQVPADRVPEPYHSLLVHEHHMTVTVEGHHGSLVDVEILHRLHKGDSYARMILLRSQSTRRVVQFGIVRIHLQYCADEVRKEIIAGEKPLGRVLIEHDVLRRIEPTAFLSVATGLALTRWFELPQPQPTYGRLAYIHCDDRPAIELLEVVAPEQKPIMST